MEFFSGLKKAYDRIETEMSKSLNFGENESQNEAEDSGNSKSEHQSQSLSDPHSEQVCIIIANMYCSYSLHI